MTETTDQFKKSSSGTPEQAAFNDKAANLTGQGRTYSVTVEETTAKWLEDCAASMGDVSGLPVTVEMVISGLVTAEYLISDEAGASEE